MTQTMQEKQDCVILWFYTVGLYYFGGVLCQGRFGGVLC